MRADALDRAMAGDFEDVPVTNAPVVQANRAVRVLTSEEEATGTEVDPGPGPTGGTEEPRPERAGKAAASKPKAAAISFVCTGCNSPQEVVPGPEARCVVCGKKLGNTVGVALLPKEEAKPADPGAPADRLLAYVFAPIPLIGLRRAWACKVLSGAERVLLSGIGLATTGAAGIFLWGVLSAPAVEPPTAASETVHHQIAAIRDLVTTFRAQSGHLPDQAAWTTSVRTADSRLADPWGRPYVYQPGQGSFTISTLGADGKPGGSGDDADVIESFEIPAQVAR